MLSLTTAIPEDLDCKAFLTALVLSLSRHEQPEDTAAHVDFSSWLPIDPNVRDAAGVQSELQTMLRHSGLHVADMISLLDTSDGAVLARSGQLSEKQFCARLRQAPFCFVGVSRVLRELFHTLDIDKQGDVGFEELFEMLRGKRHALDRRMKPRFDLRLRVPTDRKTAAGVNGALWRRLDELIWDTAVLRVLINDMLSRQDWPNGQKASVADLLREWNGQKGLSRREFVECIRASFFAPEHEVPGGAQLWEREAAAVASAAFSEIMKAVSGENFLQRVGLVHLERWLSARRPDPHGGGFISAVSDEMPAYTVRTLPLKSKRQLAQAEQARKDKERRERQRKLEAMGLSKRTRVDWVARARPAIAAAAETVAVREEERLVAEAERVLRIVQPRGGGGGGGGTSSRKGRKGAPRLPNILQRWETDAMSDLSAAFGAPASMAYGAPFSLRTKTPMAPGGRSPRPSPRALKQQQQQQQQQQQRTTGYSSRTTPGAAPAPAPAVPMVAAAGAAPMAAPPGTPPPPERPKGRHLTDEEELAFQRQCVEFIQFQRRNRLAPPRR